MEMDFFELFGGWRITGRRIKEVPLKAEFGKKS